MTLKEAIQVLKINEASYSGDETEAVDIAIKALENLNLISANACIINKLVREITDDD